MKKMIRAWLGLGGESAGAGEEESLRGLIDALDQMEPARARHLAAFAYLLGRVAHADQHVSPEETRAMEDLVVHEGGVPREQAMLIVALAKSSNLMFGGTANFLVAREFGHSASHEQKMSLMRCLFAVSTAEGDISVAEENEIQRIARELKVEHADLIALRLAHRDRLPGLSRPPSDNDGG